MIIFYSIFNTINDCTFTENAYLPLAKQEVIPVFSDHLSCVISKQCQWKQKTTCLWFAKLVKNFLPFAYLQNSENRRKLEYLEAASIITSLRPIDWLQHNRQPVHSGLAWNNNEMLVKGTTVADSNWQYSLNMDKAGSGEDKVDYYSVLGCDPSSSEEQIMTEYRVRARQSHPDKQGDTEEFQVRFN